jgi:enamine deaminase RidA (YjgF/YER057c/UK114 family)
MTRVKAGDMYYVAGQLAVGADGSVVGVGDFDAQFRQVFRNLSDVLEAVGCDFNDIAKFSTYFASADDIPHFMRLRAEHVADRQPAGQARVSSRSRSDRAGARLIFALLTKDST